MSDSITKTSYRDVAALCECKTAYAWAVAPILRKAAKWLIKAADRQDAIKSLSDKYAALGVDTVPREWIVNDLNELLK